MFFMGWFGSKKKEEEFPQIPSFQQVSPRVVPSSPVVTLNDPSEVSTTTQEIGSNCQMDKSEPFFVRIDKFNEAKKSLVEIERKMRDMEEVLVKLGETKEKEDEEIDSWKQDLRVIKGYLGDINDSVFSRL